MEYHSVVSSLGECSFITDNCPFGCETSTIGSVRDGDGAAFVSTDEQGSGEERGAEEEEEEGGGGGANDSERDLKGESTV